MQPGPDMSQLLAQAQQMQTQLAQAQQEIAASTVVGSSGNNLVSVTMTGAGEVTEVTVDPKVVDPDDIETLQDLLVGAFQEAHRNVQQLADDKLGPLAGGFGGMGDALGGLPGF